MQEIAIPAMKADHHRSDASFDSTYDLIESARRRALQYAASIQENRDNEFRSLRSIEESRWLKDSSNSLNSLSSSGSDGHPTLMPTAFTSFQPTLGSSTSTTTAATLITLSPSQQMGHSVSQSTNDDGIYTLLPSKDRYSESGSFSVDPYRRASLDTSQNRVSTSNNYSNSNSNSPLLEGMIAPASRNLYEALRATQDENKRLLKELSLKNIQTDTLNIQMATLTSNYKNIVTIRDQLTEAVDESNRKLECNAVLIASLQSELEQKTKKLSDLSQVVEGLKAKFNSINEAHLSSINSNNYNINNTNTNTNSINSTLTESGESTTTVSSTSLKSQPSSSASPSSPNRSLNRPAASTSETVKSPSRRASISAIPQSSSTKDSNITKDTNKALSPSRRQSLQIVSLPSNQNIKPTTTTSTTESTSPKTPTRRASLSTIPQSSNPKPLTSSDSTTNTKSPSRTRADRLSMSVPSSDFEPRSSAMGSSFSSILQNASASGFNSASHNIESKSHHDIYNNNSNNSSNNNINSSSSINNNSSNNSSNNDNVVTNTLTNVSGPEGGSAEHVPLLSTSTHVNISHNDSNSINNNSNYISNITNEHALQGSVSRLFPSSFDNFNDRTPFDDNRHNSSHFSPSSTAVTITGSNSGRNNNMRYSYDDNGASLPHHSYSSMRSSAAAYEDSRNDHDTSTSSDPRITKLINLTRSAIEKAKEKVKSSRVRSKSVGSTSRSASREPVADKKRLGPSSSSSKSVANSSTPSGAHSSKSMQSSHSNKSRQVLSPASGYQSSSNINSNSSPVSLNSRPQAQTKQSKSEELSRKSTSLRQSASISSSKNSSATKNKNDILPSSVGRELISQPSNGVRIRLGSGYKPGVSSNTSNVGVSRSIDLSVTGGLSGLTNGVRGSLDSSLSKNSRLQEKLISGNDETITNFEYEEEDNDSDHEDSDSESESETSNHGNGSDGNDTDSLDFNNSRATSNSPFINAVDDIVRERRSVSISQDDALIRSDADESELWEEMNGQVEGSSGIFSESTITSTSEPVSTYNSMPNFGSISAQVTSNFNIRSSSNAIKIPSPAVYDRYKPPQGTAAAAPLSAPIFKSGGVSKAAVVSTKQQYSKINDLLNSRSTRSVSDNKQTAAKRSNSLTRASPRVDAGSKAHSARSTPDELETHSIHSLGSLSDTSPYQPVFSINSSHLKQQQSKNRSNSNSNSSFNNSNSYSNSSVSSRVSAKQALSQSSTSSSARQNSYNSNTNSNNRGRLTLVPGSAK